MLPWNLQEFWKVEEIKIFSSALIVGHWGAKVFSLCVVKPFPGASAVSGNPSKLLGLAYVPLYILVKESVFWSGVMCSLGWLWNLRQNSGICSVRHSHEKTWRLSGRNTMKCLAEEMWEGMVSSCGKSRPPSSSLKKRNVCLSAYVVVFLFSLILRRSFFPY